MTVEESRSASSKAFLNALEQSSRESVLRLAKFYCLREPAWPLTAMNKDFLLRQQLMRRETEASGDYSTHEAQERELAEVLRQLRPDVYY